MFDEKMRGKNGVFSFNPPCAMNWLTENKNAFKVLSFCMLKANFKGYQPFLPAENNEYYFDKKKFCHNLKLTSSQLDRSLENLCRYGFIDIQKIEKLWRGWCKITIYVDIFHPETEMCVKKHLNEFGGYLNIA